MTEKTIYSSSNGDRWFIVQEPGLAEVFVRHQANLASGGHSTIVSVKGFLAEGHGPQHEALLRLLDDKLGQD